jgi:hypothetical protein
MLGANPFHGVSHKSAELRVEYKRRFTRPEAVLEIIDRSFELGIRGVHGYCSELEIEAISRAKEKYGNELVVVSVIPDLYAAASRQLGVQVRGGADIQKLKSLMRNMPGLVSAGLTGNLLPLVGRSLDTELNLIKPTKPSFVILHGYLTDVVSALRQGQMISLFMDKVRKIGAVPGMATHNLVNLCSALKEMKMKLPIIMTPVNANGFMMRPSQQACVEAIRELKDTVFIAKKVLAGGVIQPLEAQKYVFDNVGVHAAALGIASADEANEAFLASKSVLGERFSEGIEVL